MIANSGLSARELADTLLQLSEVHLAGPEILARLQALERQGTFTQVDFVEIQPQIEDAMGKLDKYLEQVRGPIQRCVDLPAMPQSETPDGF